jgi:hypothetical protein
MDAVSITFASWMLPAAVTVLVWLLAIFWPLRPDSGHWFDFASIFDRFFLGVGAFVAMLLVWLVWAIVTRS